MSSLHGSEPDKYDKAVTYLQDNPHVISSAWHNPHDVESGCLFQFATKTGKQDPKTFMYGCLTSIRSNRNKCLRAETPELTERIRADETIPQSVDEIKVSDLETFAKWQRILDKELSRD